MSVTNTNQRRVSFAMFAGFFLLAVLFSCMAFVKSSKIKEIVPVQELAPLKEKEQVLGDFAKLSNALCKYDNAQRNNVVAVNQISAECRRLSENLHLALKDKDTAHIYQDMTAFMRMADQYLFSLREQGTKTSAQKELYDKEMTRLRNTINDLQAKNTALQTKESILQSNNTNLQNQVNQLQMLVAQKPQSAGGGGGANCIEEMNKLNEYKTKVLTVAGAAKLNLQTIETELNKMSGFLGIGKNKTEKKNIEVGLKELGENLGKLNSK